MKPLPSRLECSGCGWRAPSEEPYPFRCAHSGEGDVDHVLRRTLDTAALRWPDGGEPDPFVRYRSLLRSHQLALAGGLADGDYVEAASALDAAVQTVDGRGFRITPFARCDPLSAALGFTARGGVWVKDETGNVSGSHKARHLMGLALHLEVASRLGLAPGDPPRLAIASCGNAALAAAVVARAAKRPLDVFVPVDAEAAVVSRLGDLGAHVVECPRRPGEAGDPAYRALLRAVAAGALPFTCQGSENGLVIEGGETLGWEIADAGQGLDRIVVQVGGGALASAVLQSQREALELGAVARQPRVDTVQTCAAFPLRRAYEKVAARVEGGEPPASALRYAARHRSEFMWPWETAPRSVAHGILDDETYDWQAVVEGMLAGGGSPVVVDEDLLEEANMLGRATTGVDADHTGTAGLAGLLSLQRAGTVDPDERVAVLFTGVRR